MNIWRKWKVVINFQANSKIPQKWQFWDGIRKIGSSWILLISILATLVRTDKQKYKDMSLLFLRVGTDVHKINIKNITTAWLHLASWNFSALAENPRWSRVWQKTWSEHFYRGLDLYRNSWNKKASAFQTLPLKKILEIGIFCKNWHFFQKIFYGENGVSNLVGPPRLNQDR